MENDFIEMATNKDLLQTLSSNNLLFYFCNFL